MYSRVREKINILITLHTQHFKGAVCCSSAFTIKLRPLNIAPDSGGDVLVKGDTVTVL